MVNDRFAQIDAMAPERVLRDPFALKQFRRRAVEAMKAQRQADIEAGRMDALAQNALPPESAVAWQLGYEKAGAAPRLSDSVFALKGYDLRGIYSALTDKGSRFATEAGPRTWAQEGGAVLDALQVAPEFKSAVMSGDKDALSYLKRAIASQIKGTAAPDTAPDMEQVLGAAGLGPQNLSLTRRFLGYMTGEATIAAIMGDTSDPLLRAASRGIVLDQGVDRLAKSSGSDWGLNSYMRAAQGVGPSKLAYVMSGEERPTAERSVYERAGAFLADTAAWMFAPSAAIGAGGKAVGLGESLVGRGVARTTAAEGFLGGAEALGQRSVAGELSLRAGKLTQAVGKYVQRAGVSTLRHGATTPIGKGVQALTGMAAEQGPYLVPDIYERANELRKEGKGAGEAWADATKEVASSFYTLAKGTFEKDTPLDERIMGGAIIFGALAAGLRGAKAVKFAKDVHVAQKYFPFLKGEEFLNEKWSARVAQSARVWRQLADTDPQRAAQSFDGFKAMFATDSPVDMDTVRAGLFGRARVLPEHAFESSDELRDKGAYYDPVTGDVVLRETSSSFEVSEELRHAIEQRFGLTGEGLTEKFTPEEIDSLSKMVYLDAMKTVKSEQVAKVVSQPDELVQWLMRRYFQDPKKFRALAKSDPALKKLSGIFSEGSLDAYLLSQLTPGERGIGSRGEFYGHTVADSMRLRPSTDRSYFEAARSMKEEGGFTIYPDGTVDRSPSGYAVAGSGPEAFYDHPPTQEEIRQFIDDNAEHFGQPGVFVGGYKMGDSYVLEASQHFGDFDDAARIGTERNQESVFDKLAGEPVFLDTPLGRQNAQKKGQPVYDWRSRQWKDPKTGMNVEYSDAAKDKGAASTRMKPSTRVPNEDVRRSEEQYREAAGIGGRPWSGYAKVDIGNARAMADYADKAAHQPNDPRVVATYKAMVPELMAQARQMLEVDGIKVEPWLKDGQPYANSAEMRADVQGNKHLYFFLTDQGFGSGEFNPNDHGGHPLLADAGMEINGHKLVYNDVLRFVHDYYTHAKEGYEFGPRGEENAYLAHASMFTPEARMALAIETKAQNNWVNFGKHLRREDGSIPQRGDADYIEQHDRPYLDQKVFPIPEELYDPERIYPEWAKATGNDSMRQYAQRLTETPEFKRWASEDGYSVLREASGKPKVFYHGSAESFNEFKPEYGIDSGGRAVFFSSDPDLAEDFAWSRYDAIGDEPFDDGSIPGAQVYPVFLRAKNVFDHWNSRHVKAVATSLKAMGGKEQGQVSEVNRLAGLIADGDYGVLENPQVIDAMKDAGFDAFFVKESQSHSFDNVAVFDPTQIKSIFNKGTFDPNNPDIRYSTRLYRDSDFDETVLGQKGERQGPFFSRLRGALRDGGVAESFVDVPRRTVQVKPGAPARTFTDKQGREINVPAREPVVRTVPGMSAGEQVQAALKNAGIKDEELRTSGLLNFLQDRADDGAPITRQDIVDYLDEWEPPVREFRLYNYQSPMQPGGVQMAETLRDHSSDASPKWANYQPVPGGEDYFELVFDIAPEQRAGLINMLIPNMPPDKAEHWHQQTTFDFAHLRGSYFDARDLSLELATTDKMGAGVTGAPANPDGRVLVIQEVQSDWAQAYRDLIEDRMANAQRDLPRAAVEQSVRDAEKTRPPFYQTWQMFVMKRAIEEAVQNDASYVAWPKAEHVKELYGQDGGNEVMFGMDDGVYRVDLFTEDGDLIDAISTDDELTFRHDVRALGWLSDEQKARILEALDNDEVSDGNYEELGPSVEGGGYNGTDLQYDEVLPKEVGRYIKQWGAEVVEGEVSMGNTTLGQMDNTGNYEDRGVWVFPVTEAMKSDVKAKGQPLYSTRLPFSEDAVRSILKDHQGERRHTYSWRTIARYLNDQEKEGMRRDVVDRLVETFNTELADIDDTVSAAVGGREAVGWYKNAGDLLTTVFEDDAPRFTAVLAATSPRVSLAQNLRIALGVWDRWIEEGRPSHEIDVDDFLKRHQFRLAKDETDSNWNAIASALTKDPLDLAAERQVFSDRAKKTEAFRRALLGDLQAVVNDTWMARFAGLDESESAKFFQAKSRYLAASAATRMAADRTGLHPSEVQESVWTFFRELATTKRGNIEGITHGDVRRADDFVSLVLKDEDARAALDELGLLDKADAAALDVAERAQREGADPDAPAAGGFGRRVSERIGERASRASESLEEQQYSTRFTKEQLEPTKVPTPMRDALGPIVSPPRAEGEAPTMEQPEMQRRVSKTNYEATGRGNESEIGARGQSVGFEWGGRTYRSHQEARKLGEAQYILGGTMDVLSRKASSGEALTDTQHAEALTMMSDLEYMMSNTQTAISEAELARDWGKAQQLRQVEADLVDKYAQVVPMLIDVGSHAGRALAARKMYVSMFAANAERAMKAIQGIAKRRLTKDEAARVIHLSNEVKQAKEALDAGRDKRRATAQKSLEQVAKDFAGRVVSLADLEGC